MQFSPLPCSSPSQTALAQLAEAIERRKLKRGSFLPAEHQLTFLANDESSFITGSDLAVEGGYLAQ